MISKLRSRFRTVAATLAAALTLLFCMLPAHAAAPSYPTGSRIGLVLPAGMTVSKRYPGFEDLNRDATIIIATLPASAYAEMDKTAVPDVLKKQGIDMQKREPIQTTLGPAFLITGTEVADKTRYRKWLLVAQAPDFTILVNVQVPEDDTTYTDAVVHTTLATLTLRDTVPEAEQLSLLPFTVGDMADFKIMGVLPGRALMLADIPDQPVDTNAHVLPARLLVAAETGGPTEITQHAEFARLAFGSIGGIKDVQVNMSESLNINGQQGFQTMAQAKDAQTGDDVMVVQWLRFGSGGFLQMVGIARADVWTAMLTRMRAVRDSIDLK